MKRLRAVSPSFSCEDSSRSPPPAPRLVIDLRGVRLFAAAFVLANPLGPANTFEIPLASIVVGRLLAIQWAQVDVDVWHA